MPMYLTPISVAVVIVAIVEAVGCMKLLYGWRELRAERARVNEAKARSAYTQRAA